MNDLWFPTNMAVLDLYLDLESRLLFMVNQRGVAEYFSHVHFLVWNILHNSWRGWQYLVITLSIFFSNFFLLCVRTPPISLNILSNIKPFKPFFTLYFLATEDGCLYLLVYWLRGTNNNCYFITVYYCMLYYARKP